jgi:hypothetical protein
LATSLEDRAVLRWELSQAIADLDRRGQLRGSPDERAALVRGELMSKENSFAGKLLSKPTSGSRKDVSRE